jgi:hypothetical protein
MILFIMCIHEPPYHFPDYLLQAKVFITRASNVISK